ncbi:uncharacterized protein Dana_GF21967 [Drosophila ananassae]|uniref:CRAL-TRIO domain-containing protein n=1 Tax=Drosophila ananassae TaxID=7217 RepID=B3MYT6_DROAN|nr:alpha-tocopherol transfer protein-like [Drosophila ananassae]EDV32780.1 uncharacterized protein Dana_GF21967 [Drosophila ananassae]
METDTEDFGEARRGDAVAIPTGQLEELITWFESNPNLPEKIEPIVMLRFMKCLEYNAEKIKALVELNYSLRNKNPHIFIERSIDDDMTAKCLRASDLLVLPGLTPEGNKLVFFRMVDMEPNARNSVEETKIFYMMSDARFTLPDVEKPKDQDQDQLNESDIADGEIQIVDIEGYTLRHLAYVSIFVLRIHMKFLQEAYPSRLKTMHVINCPSYLDRLISMMSPFIREEVRKLIKYHTDGLESLYEEVPRDMLPNEYGGKAGTIAELKERNIQMMRDQRAYLRDDRYWNVASQGKSRWSWF